MNKVLNVIENKSIKEKPLFDKTILLPIAGIIVFGAMLYWTGSHIAGGCTNLADVIKVCEVHLH